MSARRHVLVGGGVAAAATATHLRKHGFDGEIVLVGDEPQPPYERPPLSKDFLLGTTEFEEFQVRPPAWYDEQSVDLRVGIRVTAIDVPGRSVTLSTGERLGYDGLVLATGVRPRRLPGFDGDRVHYLRTAADSQRLRAQLAESERVVVIGAGFIGCEVAAAAVGLGKQVTIFDPAPTPLARVLGATIGSVMTGIHRSRGVQIRAGEYISELRHTGDGMLLTSNLGHRVECDLVVVGIGCEPNVELAAEAGLATDGGIVVDEYGRTSAPDIYAAGDVAAQYHPVYGRTIRVEHHDNALRQGANVALNLTGSAEPFAEAHWFWSDQYEHSLQSVGRPADLEDLVIRGSLEDHDFSAFSLVDGRIQAVISLNRPRDVLEVRRMLFAPHEVTAEQLRDESVPLKRLIPRSPWATARA
ncbi:NAD(P)/FAD-dependent oxidoreductase [Amycolatopsis thermoflava]|uniref:NAD(P)/FAD-dependent oxidoreductase n=1 Tax=Amycolatopsis thermoflava TaxID=84480 RepID=UPI003D75602B